MWPPAQPGSYGSQVAAGFMTPILTLASVAAFWAMVRRDVAREHGRLAGMAVAGVGAALAGAWGAAFLVQRDHVAAARSATRLVPPAWRTRPRALRGIRRRHVNAARRRHRLGRV